MQCVCGAQGQGQFCTNCGRQMVVQTPQFNPPPMPQASSSTFSIIGIVFGAISLLFFPIVFGPVGIGLSIAAITKKEKLAPLALGVSIGGMFLGFILGVVFWAGY